MRNIIENHNNFEGENKMKEISLKRSIMSVTERPLEGSIFLDGFNPDKMELAEEFADLGVKIFPAKIYIKNLSLAEENIHSLLRMFVFGAKIGILTEKGWKTFENPTPKKRYAVVMTPLTTANIPRTLGRMEKGGKTFLEILKTSRNLAKYIPTDAWDIISLYNDSFINRLKRYNKTIDVDMNNKFIKDVYKALKGTKINAFIGNRLFVEAEGELAFDKDMAGLAPEAILSEGQREFLYANAKYYGIQIPEVLTHTAYAKYAENGRREYATFPERLLAELGESERSSAAWDGRKLGKNLPKDIRQGYLNVKHSPDYKGEKEAYDTLMFYMQFGDEFLDMHYARCPECGALYYKDSGHCDQCGYDAGYSVESLDAGFRILREAERKVNEEEYED